MNPERALQSHAQFRRSLIDSIECARCKGFAWEPDEYPARDGGDNLHHPSCARVRKKGPDASP